MNVDDPGDPLLPAPREGRRRSARERQRRGPMWGCLRTLAMVFGGALLLLLVVVGGGWWYLGTTSFEGLVRLRIEQTLEAKLGRDVSIGSVRIVRSRPQKVILSDLRIANAPGGVARYFATVREVEITGGVESFWRRSLRVGRVDVRDPHLWFEVFPEGSPLVHNFPHWKTGPRRRYEIVHLQIGELFVSNGAFSFLDRKHDIEAVATKIGSHVRVTTAENLYEGLMNSPAVRVRLQDYEPFDVGMRGGFRYTPGVLALRSVALQGRGIDTFLSGKIDPVSEAVYDLRLTSRIALERVREIFRLDTTLEGTVALDTRLRGKSGEFRLTGGWSTPALTADAYALADARGRLDVDGTHAVVDVERAGYGGGAIKAHYVLTEYAEPYRMNVTLDYDRISLEQLFGDWDVKDTGLRGAATGRLVYRWNKDKLLEGAGDGTARLSPSSTAFSAARYPVPIGGATEFALEQGVVRFRSAEIDTASSHASIRGTFQIEGAVTDLSLAVRSSDFAELDRVGYNFAHSADKKDYELLGLGGSGTIDATVRGPIDAPMVAAKIAAAGAKFNDVVLGEAGIDLRYDGPRSVLTFDRARFTEGGGALVLKGTLTFPDEGPGPLFDIAAQAQGYPAQRAIDAMELDLQIGPGLATGSMLVAGTPDAGRVTFSGLHIMRADATLDLDGTVHWMPGEGNVSFDLAIAATNFPVSDIAAFLDFADLPLTGALTGELKLQGKKDALEGSGRVAVREGSIMGEPIELASADIVFTQGRMRATNALVRARAGEIRGEAELDLTNEKFSYTISSSAIDLSKLEILSSVRDLLGGTIVLNSTGAGTFEQPELVVEATLQGGTLRGLALPEGSAPPSLYLAIRGGRLIVRGGITDIVTVEGEGAVGEKLAVDGTVRVTVSDIARALALSPSTASLPAAGKLVLDLRLAGALSPIEALVVEASAPVFDVTFADHEFTPAEPLRIALRNGRVEFDSFELRRGDSVFGITGWAELAGAKRVNLDLRGRIEAALVQLFARDVRADGHADVVLSVRGTVTDPTVVGTVDLIDAELKFAGFPQLIDEINGRIAFNGERVTIESLRALVGGGTVAAGGWIALDGLKPEQIRITLQGDDVALRYYSGVTLESDFQLLLTGDLQRQRLSGTVDVTRGLYFRDFEIQQALLDLILARDRVTTVAGAGWQDRLTLDIDLNAPGTLAVRNNLAEVTGSATLEIHGTLASPIILGEITLDEGGTVRLQNVDYRLTRGTIAFQNPFRIDPFIDVTLEGTVSGSASELEGGPLEITVNLTGTLDRLTPAITSDPPASDITLFSILGFGGMGGRSSTQAGGGFIGESLIYQSLSNLIGSRVFPFVDSFAFDPGTLDTGVGSGPKVTFEKRLSNKIRFLIVYNLDNNQSREVVEWAVNRSWSLQLTRDETDEYRLDARFRRRYEAQWSLRNDEEGFSRAAVMRGATAAGAKSAPSLPVTRPPGVTPVAPNAFSDRPVSQVNFIADAQFDTGTIAQEVTLAPGKPLTIRELQSSIKNLYATGNFRDIRVDASPAAAPDSGTVVTFSLFLHYRVGTVDIAGLGRRDAARVEREVSIRKGDVLSLDAVDDNARAVQEALHAHGYLEATVDPETNFDRARSLAEVVLRVTPGTRAVVGEVTIDGPIAPFTREQLIDRMKRKPGQAFEEGEAREDANRMKNFLVRRDYRRADVDYLGHTFDAASKRVALRYRASTGPMVKVAVEGIARRAVRRWLPFARNQEYSEDVIDRAADEMIHGLQQRGHFLATVDTESALENDVWTTTFHVDAGPVFRLASVDFSGNEKVSEKQLHEVVETTPRGGFRRIVQGIFRRPTGVTREQLSSDRDAIEAWYRLQGFSVAEAAEPVADARPDGTLHVRFPITEGPQTLVTELKIEGNQSRSADDLPRPRLREGEPLNPQTLRDDVIAIQSAYAEKGYTEVQVRPRVETTEDLTGARVTYVVAEGPEVTVDEVVVRGNTYTDRDVVLRTSDIDPGDPFTYTSILEAQRNLYRLGIFNRVEIQPEQAGTTVSDRDVVIEVEEGKNLTLTGAIGLRAQRGSGTDNGIHERLAGAIAHRNLFGTGRYLGLEAVYSSSEEEAFLTFREPFVSKWDVPIQLQVFQSDDATRPGTPILQRGTSIEATKVARSLTRWSLRYEYKISKCRETGELCDELRAGEIEGIDRSLVDIQISSVTPTFFWDHRDDIINPHRGFFTSASIEHAAPLFSATAHFLKEYAQGAFYLPVGRNSVFAFAARLGFIQPKGGTGHDEIPLSERFTAGGETTHRAFRLDLLGDLCRDENYQPVADCEPTLFKPNDDPEAATLPKGGSGLLLFNAEYRFPIFGTFGGALFADAGNVYRSGAVRLDRLRYGVGVGFRYLSPVGPLRIDLGWPLERKPYEDGFQYFITLGYPF